MDELCKKSQLLKEIFQQVEPWIILDMIAAPPDAVRLLLRDGRTLLARLDREGTLRLDEIDGVC